MTIVAWRSSLTRRLELPKYGSDIFPTKIHIYCFFFFGLELWALIGIIFTCSRCFCQYFTTMNSIECLHIIFLNDSVNDYDTFSMSLQMVILRYRAPKILFGRTNCSAAIDRWAVVYLLRW